MSMAGHLETSRWSKAWPDLLAFAVSLGMAWQLQWQTKDLVWSLWLSSLLVGYAMIVWTIFSPAIHVAWKAWSDRELLQGQPKGPMALGGAAYLVGGLFLLAFFTVHFGMFHFVHSVFLNGFFPITGGPGMLGVGGYLAVLEQYWFFVPLAALAERKAFRIKEVGAEEPPDTSVKAADIVARKARNSGKGFGGMMAPYKNVIRLHLLIFFFAFAHFSNLDNFAVYAVVYAVYFFPWRLLRKSGAESGLA